MVLVKAGLALDKLRRRIDSEAFLVRVQGKGIPGQRAERVSDT